MWVHPSSLVNSTARLGYRCIQEPDTFSITPGGALFVTGHRENPSLCLWYLFCCPSRGSPWVVFLIFSTQVNDGKMGKGFTRTWVPPFLQLLYFLLSVTDLFNQRERVYFHSSPHWDFGPQRYSIMGQLSSSYHNDCSSSSSSRVGFGVLFFWTKAGVLGTVVEFLLQNTTTPNKMW